MVGDLPAATKSRRVRTGCLTCRERHLKCDEATPDCRNCRKSNRRCKRGIRLNFLDIQVYSPTYLPSDGDWDIHFQDESRLIASEYQGGLKRYTNIDMLRLTRPASDFNMILKRLDGTARARDGQDQLHPYGVNMSRSSHSVPIPSLQLMQPCSRDRVLYRPGPYSAVARGMHTADGTGLAYTGAPSSSHSTTLYGYPQPEHSVPIKVEAGEQEYAVRDLCSATANGLPLRNPPPTRRCKSEDKMPLDELETSSSLGRPPNGERDILATVEEVHCMQVFVEEVGAWMDSFDKDNHFSELIPCRALKSPKLLNAFLACGAKHLAQLSPEKEREALFYYNTATTQLLRSLQNPDRDVGECAIAAVVLNVYEIMSNRPAQGMNHVAGARALIRESGWNAKSRGSMAACFWLNIGMEVLNCLEKNYRTTWDPDHWGLNMDMASGAENGADTSDEQLWMHRMLYIVARVVNFRAAVPRFSEPRPHNERFILGNQLSEWRELKRLCDAWSDACPRTMHPMGYLYGGQSTHKSSFPQIWLIKRPAVLGCLFYHTALCILAQTHPVEPATSSDEMRDLHLHHAHQVCGIVAHTNDRGVASAAVRALAIAAPALVDRDEQNEALEILRQTNARSGWKLVDIETELKSAWGWNRGVHATPPRVQSRRRSTHVDGGIGFLGCATMSPLSTLISTSTNEGGEAQNPLSLADFSLPDHPYKNWYEPPNRISEFSEPPF